MVSRSRRARRRVLVLLSPHPPRILSFLPYELNGRARRKLVNNSRPRRPTSILATFLRDVLLENLEQIPFSFPAIWLCLNLRYTISVLESFSSKYGFNYDRDRRREVKE